MQKSEKFREAVEAMKDSLRKKLQPVKDAHQEDRLIREEEQSEGND